MATIDITKVEYVKTRDGVGMDEIDIYLAPRRRQEFISGQHLLDKSKNDDEVTLTIHESFSTKVAVQLRERKPVVTPPKASLMRPALAGCVNLGWPPA